MLVMGNLQTIDTQPPDSPAARPVLTAAIRAQALQLAALAGCDTRTAIKAILHGTDEIRTMTVREALEDGMRRLGIANPSNAVTRAL
jgi:hypothetical protein